MDDNLKHLAALTHFPKFGPARLKRIKNFFQNYKEAFLANSKDFLRAGIEEKISKEFISIRGEIIPDKIVEMLEKEKIKISVIEDNSYPKLLKEIYDPPQLLYYKGELLENEELCLAVVGARKFSNYGKRAAEDMASVLAANGLTVVSGMAIGIDALAHRAAIEAGGRTVAVLGSGLDNNNIYPVQNRFIADKIIANNGAIVSEFPIGTKAVKFNFPQRNRIVSGMSLGTVVVEAGEKSGALITARFALEQNREVFAVPGSIYSPVSQGANNLLKQGARVATSPHEIIEALNLPEARMRMANKTSLPHTPEEEIILTHVRGEPRHVNELVRLTGLDTSKINSTLAIMEMKGLIKNLGGMQYAAK